MTNYDYYSSIVLLPVHELVNMQSIRVFDGGGAEAVSE